MTVPCGLSSPLPIPPYGILHRSTTASWMHHCPVDVQHYIPTRIKINLPPDDLRFISNFSIVHLLRFEALYGRSFTSITNQSVNILLHTVHAYPGHDGSAFLPRLLYTVVRRRSTVLQYSGHVILPASTTTTIVDDAKTKGVDDDRRCQGK